MVEGAALEVFGDDVGPALVFDRNEFEDEGVVQFQADPLLALKAVVEGRVALEFQVGNFKRHQPLPVSLVLRLENGAHATAAQDLGDAEAVVQQVSRPKRQIARVHGFVVLGHFLATGHLFQRACFAAFHAGNVAWNRVPG